MLFIGISSHARKRNDRHLVALEADLAIFNVFLCPLCKETPLFTCGSVPHTTSLADEDKHSRKVAKCFCICKYICPPFDISIVQFCICLQFYVHCDYISCEFSCEPFQLPPNLMFVSSTYRESCVGYDGYLDIGHSLKITTIG